MKILHIYRNEPNADCKKLVEVVSEGNDNDHIKLFEGTPDYSKVVDMVFTADKTICWW
ncbi:MAG: hypothetical protein KKB91_12435 [Proteobacteria bacterium]|jgi:hypothetical protein|nr:hypothetical protein [Pseudomonadota bacterium]MCG2744475.1 hypothetical protein [Desulfobacteraceae bacterium]MDO8946708.1 hypothetical protein [Desulfocapsaceae bacterium]MBU3983859.1 hypothetical protein [Pseudomonadota bacterium]MBU4028678.1 hypothetical protein [Pseudomonadota bacterium]